jgi:branched-chain amino acid transport system substrate-binding protein
MLAVSHARECYEASRQLKDLHIPCLLPGVMTNTSPSDFAPLDQLRLMKFEGEHWHLFGDTIGSELGE